VSIDHVRLGCLDVVAATPEDSCARVGVAATGVHPGWSADREEGTDLGVVWLRDAVYLDRGAYAQIGDKAPRAKARAVAMGWATSASLTLPTPITPKINPNPVFHPENRWGMTEEGEASPALLAANLTVSGKKKWMMPGSRRWGEDGEDEVFVPGAAFVMTGPDARETCQGDSGGPLFVDGKQIGVTNFGPLTACGEERRVQLLLIGGRSDKKKIRKRTENEPKPTTDR